MLDMPRSRRRPRCRQAAWPAVSWLRDDDRRQSDGCVRFRRLLHGCLSFVPLSAPMNGPAVRAAAWGLVFTLVLGVLILMGSRNLAHFDAALVGYTFATLFA